MKKTNNKGFSLVELIIVIAIMAILAGALAPALIKYINKSRRSTDVQNADSLRTALQTALSDPDAADATSANSTGLQAASTITSTGDAFQKEVYSIVGKASLKTKYKSKATGAPAAGSEFYFKVDQSTNEVIVYADNSTSYELSPSTCTAWSK